MKKDNLKKEMAVYISLAIITAALGIIYAANANYISIAGYIIDLLKI